jgi:hypothetical protein
MKTPRMMTATIQASKGPIQNSIRRDQEDGAGNIIPCSFFAVKYYSGRLLQMDHGLFDDGKRKIVRFSTVTTCL